MSKEEAGRVALVAQGVAVAVVKVFTPYTSAVGSGSRCQGPGLEVR